MQLSAWGRWPPLGKARPGIRFNEHIEGDGPIIFVHACKLGLEGIVSKRKDSMYRSGRSPDWLKKKNPYASGETGGGGGLGQMAVTQGKMPYLCGMVLLATLLIAAPSAHAACKSPKNICKHFDDCLQRTSDPNNKDVDDIRAGVKARDGQIVLAGAEACARDLGRKQQWNKWARGCSVLELVQIARTELELGKVYCDRYSQ